MFIHATDVFNSKSHCGDQHSVPKVVILQPKVHSTVAFILQTMEDIKFSKIFNREDHINTCSKKYIFSNSTSVNRIITYIK